MKGCVYFSIQCNTDFQKRHGGNLCWWRYILPCKNYVPYAWAQIRGGGGGTGGRVPPPPRFFRWRTQYQMSPPPHVLGVGWKIYIINVPFCVIYNFFAFFFFFVFCLSKMFQMWERYPYKFWLARLSTQMALRKKCFFVKPYVRLEQLGLQTINRGLFRQMYAIIYIKCTFFNQHYWLLILFSLSCRQKTTVMGFGTFQASFLCRPFGSEKTTMF